MKWLLIGLAVLAALILVLVIGGLLLPQSHVASRTATFKQPRAVVWAALTNFTAFPSWRADVTSVEVLGPKQFREVGSNGAILMDVVETTELSRLVTRIADPKLPYGGTWTYELADAPGGSTLTITERGEVYNPIFRFLSKFVFGHTATLEKYLGALSKKFGES